MQHVLSFGLGSLKFKLMEFTFQRFMNSGCLVSPYNDPIKVSCPFLPDDAFGSADAGTPVQPGQAGENELGKMLRQAGFPEVESKVNPESVSNKILTSLQKRVLKLVELNTKLEACKSNPLVAKNLRFALKSFEHHLVFRQLSCQIRPTLNLGCPVC